MVCVLQSKLPRSSAIFRLYCKPFFFPPKSPHILHLLLLLPPDSCFPFVKNAARTSALLRLKWFWSARPPLWRCGGNQAAGRRVQAAGRQGKKLYHVYYPPASKFQGVRLRWNRPGVIIIACCLLDRTLK